MSHHGSEPFDEQPDAVKKLLADLKSSASDFKGAIGAYPHGMLTPKDEGSIQFSIGDKDGKVVIDFGTPTAWVGMTAQQALDLAAAIMKRARIVAGKNGETVHVTIGG